MLTSYPLRAVLFSFGITLLSSLYMAFMPGIQFSSVLFLLAAALVQSALLCLPAIICYQFYRRSGGYYPSIWLAWSVYAFAFLEIVFVLANYKLHEMYGFYFNFFVFNLLTTPGGVEAMGVSASTNTTLAVLVLLLALITAAVVRFVPIDRVWPRFMRPRYGVLCLSLLFVVQASWYAWSEYRYDRTVLQIADRIIWYVPVTANGFIDSLGLDIEKADTFDVNFSAKNGSLAYPHASQTKFTTPYNIVWLVAESWRADMLTPEFMPNTWRFAQKTQQFRQHYSGGNGTRMGMFSQFYGLYGSYWFDFLYQGRAPLLMEKLQCNGYEMKAFTSSKFSYPEFDKTVFANFEDSQLQSFSDGEGWQRDRKNTTDLIHYLDGAKDPSFGFMFFESAHANYYFPPEDVIAPDYLKDFNYLTVDVDKNIERIRNRYINATHHLDSQLGRVFKALEATGKLDHTIVIVTGDHGEEFMENGRWGHNSTFSQEQIRVPLLVYVPGAPPAVHDVMSSHLDLPATVLAALGDTVDPAVYSYGDNLLSPDFERDYTVVSDWHGNTLVTPDVKMVFSKKGAAYDDVTTDLNDDPIDLALVDDDFKTSLGIFARELSRFYR